jgi:hypothetical protein
MFRDEIATIVVALIAQIARDRRNAAGRLDIPLPPYEIRENVFG